MSVVYAKRSVDLHLWMALHMMWVPSVENPRLTTVTRCWRPKKSCGVIALRGLVEMAKVYKVPQGHIAVASQVFARPLVAVLEGKPPPQGAYEVLL